MDNLKTLFEKKNYKLIIDLTSTSDDVTSIIYRLNAFIALGNYSEALNLIETRKDIIYQKDPIKCMDMHIDLLLHENKIIDAVDAINEYKNMPYVSQVVEEHLKELPNRLNNPNKNNENPSELNEEELKNLFLKSNDNEQIIADVYRLKKYDITPYISTLKTMLLRGDLSNEAKTMALLLLVAKKVNMDLAINKLNSVYSVNPSKVTPPFTDKNYQDSISLIYSLSKDTSLQDIAINLFNSYIMIIYPLNPFDGYSSKEIAVAFIVLAKQYLKLDDDIESFIENNIEDINKEETLIELLKLRLDK